MLPTFSSLEIRVRLLISKIAPLASEKCYNVEEEFIIIKVVHYWAILNHYFYSIVIENYLEEF